MINVSSSIGHGAELTVSNAMLQRVHCGLFHIFLMINCRFSEGWISSFVEFLLDDGTRCQWVIGTCC